MPSITAQILWDVVSMVNNSLAILKLSSDLLDGVHDAYINRDDPGYLSQKKACYKAI
jgi:hypothetical protein